MSLLPAHRDLASSATVEVIDLDSDAEDVVMLVPQAASTQANVEVIDLTLLPVANYVQERRFNTLTGLAPVQFVQPRKSPSRSPSPSLSLPRGPLGPSSAEIYRAMIMPGTMSQPSRKSEGFAHRGPSDVIVLDSDSDDGEGGHDSGAVEVEHKQSDVLLAGLYGTSHTTDTPHSQLQRRRRCEICEIDLPEDQTLAAHNSSIAHLHARSALAEALAPTPVPRPVSATVPEDSIGLRMLKMSGWTPGTGLGAENQGRVAPIDVQYKNDTKGLGAPTRRLIIGEDPDPARRYQNSSPEQAVSIKAREAARLADKRDREQILAYLKS
ncbi:G patch domain and ankyrin repeat-containing protein 1 [Geranomyces michiganensis]|nr:G patch domain and ankyrin repeat-containing protein 1 [Geranomyces michiganensis]